jgi:N-dimethylarginine dimethylaminohydrolase
MLLAVRSAPRRTSMGEAVTHSVLMCEPVYFRIDYEINPWMRRSNAVTGPQALSQWRTLRDLVAGLGVRVELVEQEAAVPDMTFTANAGIVIGRRFVPSNFRFPERQAEAALFTQWFVEHGYEVETIHEPHYWEGEGDVLPGDGQVFAGYRFRTENRALDHLEQLLGQPLVRLELADPRFYHLDTCFCPLGAGRALYYPPAFTEEARALLQKHVPDLIAVPPADAERFACNALVVDDAVVMNTGCAATMSALQDRGLRCLPTPTDEFIKAGGSVKCLVLMLDAFEP